jgi:hypothetical protein
MINRDVFRLKPDDFQSIMNGLKPVSIEWKRGDLFNLMV